VVWQTQRLSSSSMSTKKRDSRILCRASANTTSFLAILPHYGAAPIGRWLRRMVRSNHGHRAAILQRVPASSPSPSTTPSIEIPRPTIASSRASATDSGSSRNQQPPDHSASSPNFPRHRQHFGASFTMTTQLALLDFNRFAQDSHLSIFRQQNISSGDGIVPRDASPAGPRHRGRPPVIARAPIDRSTGVIRILRAEGLQAVCCIPLIHHAHTSARLISRAGGLILSLRKSRAAFSLSPAQVASPSKTRWPSRKAKL